jgi:hypothetical protein
MFVLDNKYPIDNAEQIKQASDYFEKHLDKFEPVDRSKAAYRIEKQASKLGCPVDKPWIKNYGRAFKKTAAYSPSFKRNMEIRKVACKNAGTRITVSGESIDASKMADDIIKQASKGKLSPIAAITTINEFDKLANLQGSYDRLIRDPLFTVFGDDINPEYDTVKVAENSSVSNYDLMRVPHSKEKMEKIASIFGDEVKERFSKQPVESFNQLSSLEQTLFSEQING